MEEYCVLMSLYRWEQPGRLTAAAVSMMEQTVPPEQLVLVWDGPLTEALEAESAALEGRYLHRVTVVRLEKNVGLGAALNAGLTHCSRELVARMDSDDIALPRRMELQLAALAADPALAAVGGQMEEFDGDPACVTGRRVVPLTGAGIAKMCRSRTPMNHVTVTFRRSAVEAAGGYPDLRGFEDHGLWAAMLARGMKLANVEEVCVLARADREMHRRRGGRDYAARSAALQRYLAALGLCSPLRAAANTAVRTAAAVMPAELRRQLYRLFLRKGAGA